MANIFCHSLGVTSHAKTFLTVCRFRTARGIRSKTVVIRSNGLGYLFGKNCHPFERLGLSVRGKLSSVRTAWDIRLKKLLSVRTARAIRSKKNLSTVRATEAICSKINFSRVSIPKPCRRQPLASNNLLFSNVTKFVYKRIIYEQLRISAPLKPSSLSYHQSIIGSIDIRFIHYLSFFFSTSFPKIIFFIFYAFVVYEPAERNFIFLACRKHKTRRIIFLGPLYMEVGDPRQVR